MLHCRAGFLQDHKLEGVALALDVAGVEMTADHENRLVGKARKQLPPRYRGLFSVAVSGRGPAEMCHLAGMVGDIAREQAFLAIGLDVDAHMARAVAGGRD